MGYREVYISSFFCDEIDWGNAYEVEGDKMRKYTEKNENKDENENESTMEWK